MPKLETGPQKSAPPQKRLESLGFMWFGGKGKGKREREREGRTGRAHVVEDGLGADFGVEGGDCGGHCFCLCLGFWGSGKRGGEDGGGRKRIVRIEDDAGAVRR